MLPAARTHQAVPEAPTVLEPAAPVMRRRATPGFFPDRSVLGTQVPGELQARVWAEFLAAGNLDGAALRRGLVAAGLGRRVATTLALRLLKTQALPVPATKDD